MISSSVSEVVARGYQNAICYQDPEQAEAHIIRVINQLVVGAGAKEIEDPVLLNQLLGIMQRNFSHMAAFEIKTAYEQYMKDPDTSGKRGEFYGGQLTTTNFLGILGWWDKKREKILNGLRAEQSKLESAKDLDSFKSIKELEFERTFIAKVVQQREKIEQWDDVPLWWYDALDKRGWLPLDREAVQAAWSDSRNFLDQEVKKRILGQPRTLLPQKMEEKKIDKEQIRKNIARKLYLLKMIVNNSAWPDCLMENENQ